MPNNNQLPNPWQFPADRVIADFMRGVFIANENHLPIHAPGTLTWQVISLHSFYQVRMNVEYDNSGVLRQVADSAEAFRARLDRLVLDTLMENGVPGTLRPSYDGRAPLIHVDKIEFRRDYWDIYVLPVDSTAAVEYYLNRRSPIRRRR